MNPRLPSVPPVPASMRLAFLLGPVTVCAVAAGERSSFAPGELVRGGAVGLAAGLLLTAGLALAERFFAGHGARLVGGLAFAALLAVSGAAVGFAGCIPYPYIHTIQPARAATVPARARANGSPAPSPAPQPTPRVVLDWRAFPWN